MKKENFICPCCGLPNHLEFQSEEDYDRVREQEATGVVDNINTIFNKYLVGDEEGRNPSNEVKLELKARLEKIQQISNRFNEQSFQDWFDKNVVCFINDEPKFWTKYPYYSIDITEIIKALNENMCIYENVSVINNSLNIFEQTKIEVSQDEHLDNEKYNIVVTFKKENKNRTCTYGDITYTIITSDYEGGTIVENVAGGDD